MKSSKLDWIAFFLCLFLAAKVVPAKATAAAAKAASSSSEDSSDSEEEKAPAKVGVNI